MGDKEDIESVSKTPDYQIAPMSNSSANSGAKEENVNRNNSSWPKKNPKWAFWRRDQDPFSGKRYYDAGYWYRRPTREYIEKEFSHGQPVLTDQTEYRHRDIYGRVTTQRKDVLQYISPSESLPRPLLVQATPEVFKSQPAGDWRRVKLSGKVPTVLKVSEWALSPSYFKPFKVVLVVPVILILLSLPLEKVWDDSTFDDSYTEFPNYTWDYPKHARNKLDMRPGFERNAENGSIKSDDKSQSLTNKVRLLRPRLLVVFKNGRWELTSETSRIPYVFISFTVSHFPSRKSPIISDDKVDSARQTIEELAQKRTLEANVEAYWVDFRCSAPDEEKELHSADVHRMCDVIRGAENIFVILPDLSPASKLSWGARMWTLPEALLARRQELTFCSPDETQVLSKLAMADQVWDDGDAKNGDHQPTRLLAEHYSNVLTLGRLELFTVALDALATRKQSGQFSPGDVAYALMGLLHNRIDLDRTDSLFQSLAKLSLANDSDRLIERMVCMFPDPDVSEGENNIFLTMSEPDQYHTQLWDIEPLCQVAGVGTGHGEVILDGCRGVSIRWKAFPQMKYKRSEGWRKLFAEVVLRSGAFWSGLGLGLIIKYAWDYNNNIDNSNNWYGTADWSNDVGLIFLGALAVIFAFLLSLGAPSAVRRLYGGRVMQSAPWLVGFEGTMPVDELEKIVFGNDENRLTYEPSSTLFCERDSEERIGIEPAWVRDSSLPRPKIPKGHRLYTLVDTGSLTVSIFSAVRPPSVALIAGREGGMLRTVLCHYERSDNCLYKETVVRMDSMTLNQAKTLSWIKVSMGNDRDRLHS